LVLLARKRESVAAVSFGTRIGRGVAQMAAWSRIGRGGAQLSQSLSRAALASEGGATPGASSALRNASGAPSRGGLGQRVSPLHGLALAGLADRSAGGGVLSRGISTTAPRLQPRSAAAAVAEPLDGEGAPRLNMPSLGPTKPNEKPRVVVLGTGWAACRLLKDVDTRAYDVVCVSPRNHMVFTPLLASTCVGTLEFRSVVEPVNRIQTALSTQPGSYFYLANCSGIDTQKHEVRARASAFMTLLSSRFSTAPANLFTLRTFVVLLRSCRCTARPCPVRRWAVTHPTSRSPTTSW
jgi:NADH:ubiquinone reductase (non-electrogenic)